MPDEPKIPIQPPLAPAAPAAPADPPAQTFPQPIRDWWDCDEWGRITPGYCYRR